MRSFISFSCLVLSKKTRDWLTLRLAAGLVCIWALEANEFIGKFMLEFSIFCMLAPVRDVFNGLKLFI